MTASTTSQAASQQTGGTRIAGIRQALSQAAGTGLQLLRWWRSELLGLVPSRLRRALGADPLNARILIDASGTDIRQVVVTGSFVPDERLDGPLDAAAALAFVAKRRRRWGMLMRVDVVVPMNCCLVRRRTVPAAAGERVAGVLALTIERAMPFAMADIRHAWVAAPAAEPTGADPAGAQVVHVIAKRNLIDPLLAQARGAGVPVSGVDVIGADGAVMGVNLLSRSETPPSLTRLTNRAIAIAAVVLGVIAAATVFLALQRQNDALAQLEAQTLSTRKEAQAARKKVDDAVSLSERIGLLRQRRTESVRVVALWDEVTRRLPDSAWLTNMRVENETVWIDGYARSASELVAVVAASPMFSGVTLSAPVVREDGRASERFQLRMKVESAATATMRKAEAR